MCFLIISIELFFIVHPNESMEVPVVPWDDFLIDCSNINGVADTSELFESEWEWLKQLCDLAGEDCCSEVNNSFQQVTLTLRLCPVF